MVLNKYSNNFTRPSRTLESITFYSFGDGDSLSHLRVLGPARQLGIKVIKGVENGKVYIDRVNDGDVVVLQRDFPRDLTNYEKVLSLAKELEKPIILDIDDLLFDLPKDHPDRLNRAYTQALLPLFQALLEVDLVIVSTQALFNYFNPYNKNIVVVPNYLDDSLWELTPPANIPTHKDVVSIGYMGSYTHRPDVGSILPVLSHLIDRYPSSLEIHFWGMQPPGLLALNPQSHWHSMSTPTYADFAKAFQSQHADIFIAPLVENSFNLCKSSIKYLEYTALGVPGVYSNFEPYSNVIVHGYNGFLASSPNEWEDCLVRLIENRELRLTVAINAQKNVESNWMLSQNASKWLDACQKALDMSDLKVLHIGEEPFLRIFKSLTHQILDSYQYSPPQLEDLKTELAEIKSSKAWKIALLFRHIRNVIAPPNSIRARWISKFASIFVIPLRVKIQERIWKRNSFLISASGLFDSKWYLTNNLDVERLGIDPLRHYLLFGGFEGRDPGPQFSSSWYLSAYRDVELSGVNPLVHYLKYGRVEGRRAVPDQVLHVVTAQSLTSNKNTFNQALYVIKVLFQSINARRVKKVFGYIIHGDVKAIKHGLLFFSQHANLDPVDDAELELIHCAQFFRSKVESEYLIEKLEQEIYIVVPVFNGQAFLPALFDSLYKNTDTLFRLIIIDDNSTDPFVRPFLEDLAENHRNIILLFNKENKGFVKTINIASTYVQNHFVILNTDVEVPKGWLQRLMKPIIDNPNTIASTTPFTNSGTICSFPKALVDNPIFANLDVSAVDSAFKQIDTASIFIEMPTGVGFCMGINWNVWKDIGSFDEDRFGKGYGEENDWCMRAISAGFYNLMVPNLFVYHKHGGSFPSEEKQKLMKENWEKLIGLHPAYPSLVQKFIAADLPKPLRKFAGLILMSDSSMKRPVFIVDHQIGGGANLYREQIVQDRLKSDQAVFILTYDLNWQAMKLQVMYKEYSEIFRVNHPKDLLILEDYMELSEIYYNNLVTYKDPLIVIETIIMLKHVFQAKLKVFVHDHYSLCPSYTLLDYKGSFCNLPAENICNICLPRNDNRIPIDENGITDIMKWRQGWAKLLSEADQVVFFSKSSQILLQKIYNLKSEQMSIQPHTFISPFTKKPRVDLRAPLCIGVVGTINYHKGSQIVLDIARILEVKHPEVKIIIIGNMETFDDLPNLAVLGPYEQSELPDLIEKYKINLCFFSSIIPETFSYVTSELIALEVPVCSFDIGAPAERIGQYKFGHLISRIDAETAVEEIEFFYNQLRSGSPVI